ncbi:ABC transport protein, ATP-binding component [Neorhizobium galegae bv. officinalis bv. officinalis str. HAMBI 1141]|uniref:ABC transport protein, ATP-binding component n=1 Tax=Neorhizobium galegae bv. officinalis bv. officinalis str. HAMBI 1141 TaxID=1028801 RepID=A0A068TD50_NEOGA|nr:ABC transporter ATP-binding protein [Neorhizobium galegae]CDN55966.1 ABC transport protein, ATP-binding component [Neorhizobium galegae bv. officinalis bv. officinalis str. HAMBI 1141]
MTFQPPATHAAVSTAGVELHYGATPVLKGIDISLSKGKTLALLGPSGCGKTTLLRLVAGLLAPTKGSISIVGQVVADAAANTFSPPEKRNLGMVFQDYALWPHLTVGGNVSFPLEMRGLGKAERQSRTMRALERVGLGAYVDRRPSDLSGGQQQRVAIARAIVAEPQLILFDEPLSNLDRELRENMVGELAELIATLGLTAIYVTHDHAEALTLADDVAVMRGGLIEQLASPDQLIDKPATPEVADFLRLGGIADLDYRDGLWVFKGSDVALLRSEGDAGASARVLIPVGSISVSDVGPGRLAATVLRSQFRGDGHLATVSLVGPTHMELQVLSRVKLRPGDGVGLSIDPDQIRWFSPRVHSSQKESLQHA